jgi:hypothetical protein
MKRRTYAAIEATEKLHRETVSLATEIAERVNGDDEANYVRVGAVNIGGVKAEYQHGLADTLVVSFSSKDAALIERVARAIKTELKTELRNEDTK